MPTNRHASVLIKVNVAAVRPTTWIINTDQRHDDRHHLEHPWWKHLWFHLDAAISVYAGTATWKHQPACFPRNRTVWALWLIPFDPFLRRVEELLRLLFAEGARQHGRKGSPAFIVEDVVPVHSRHCYHFPDALQSCFRPRLFPLALCVLVWRVFSFVLTLALATIFFHATFKALAL